MAAQQPFIGAGILEGLAAAGSRINGGRKPTSDEIAIELIDEDPDQPRRNFDQAELEAMAESMKIVPPGEVEPIGVLEPIGVTIGPGDRYTLVFGARRLRAARIAGLSKIPARIVPPNQAGLTAQVIENQHRSPLANSDMARAVLALESADTDRDTICKVVNLPLYRYWHYHAVSRMPAWIIELLDEYDMRAVYELYTTWEKSDEDGRLYLKATVESTRETTPTWELTTASVKHIVKNRPAINDLQNESGGSPRETGDEVSSIPRRRKAVLAAVRLPSKVPSDLLRGLIATLKPADQKRAWAFVQGELDLRVPEKVKP